MGAAYRFFFCHQPPGGVVDLHGVGSHSQEVFSAHLGDPTSPIYLTLIVRSSAACFKLVGRRCFDPSRVGYGHGDRNNPTPPALVEAWVA